MENKLLKNGMSIFLVIVMVMSIISVPALTGSNVNAATSMDAAKAQCSFSVSPALAVNATSTIAMTGYNLEGNTALKYKIVPYRVKVEGIHYFPTSKTFSAPPYSTTTLIEYPDNYKVTAIFNCYSWNGTRWATETNYEPSADYHIKPIVVLNANKGKVNGQSTLSMPLELTTTLGSLPKAKRKGFTFTGWYASKKGYSSEKLGAGSYLVVRNLHYRNTTSKTAYAQWKKKIKVKFNANGGKVKKKSKKVTYVSNSLKKTYGALPTPKKGKKYFAGWYTKKKGGKRISKYSDVTKTKNHTLYAHWY